MLNEKDYEYFETDVWCFNVLHNSGKSLISDMKKTIANRTIAICESLKEGRDRDFGLDILLEMHAEYEVILKKLDQMEGAKKE